MAGYSIGETAKTLEISEHGLRYYDKMGILSPKRKDNSYRYYSDDDILLLKYIGIMKFAGFSLREVKRVMDNLRNPSLSNACVNDTIQLIGQKEQETKAKIKSLERTLEIFKLTVDGLGEKNEEHSHEKLLSNRLENLYDDIKGCSELLKDFGKEGNNG